MADPTAPGRFAREGGRNRFTARRATVLRVERVAPPIIRVTVSGPEFEDFTSGGPADHVRVFFPDAATGELVAPTPVGPGEDGIVRPDRASIARDFTPLPRAWTAGLEAPSNSIWTSSCTLIRVRPHPGRSPLVWATSSSSSDRADPGGRLRTSTGSS